MASRANGTTSPPLRVLCFGDSLTSGFCDMGLTEHPYSITLKNRLSKVFGAVNVQVFTSGVPGDVASGPGFRRRMANECERRPYDWVIVLAGTNDLAHEIPVETIYNALSNVWEIALIKGSKVLALTVPECKAQIQWLDDNRDTLNSSIKNHQAKNYHAFDLMSKLPYHALPAQDQQKYWDDGLHLTPAGYDWMGNHIADELLELISKNIQMQKPSSRSKTTPVQEENSLDEEAGSPKNISKGYVVVRKRDLD